jgi:hypothetical protein
VIIIEPVRCHARFSFTNAKSSCFSIHPITLRAASLSFLDHELWFMSSWIRDSFDMIVIILYKKVYLERSLLPTYLHEFSRIVIRAFSTLHTSRILE